MHFFAGCMSGAKANTVPVVNCTLQGMTVTLRNSTISKIQPFLSTTNKVSEPAAYGDFARSSTDYYVADSSDILLAASVNAYDNGPFLPAQYQVPGIPEFAGWDNHGTSSAIGLRLGVATNDVLSSYPAPEQVYFAQNFAGEDSLTMLQRYYASTGFILEVDEGTKVLVDDDSQIVLPIGGSTVVGDTLLAVVMHELFLITPDGYTIDYSSTIKGLLSSLTPLERNTTLSVYRKVMTADDISTGTVTFNTVGSI